MCRNLILIALVLYNTILFGQTEYPLNLIRNNIRLPLVQDRELDYKLRDPSTVFYKLPQVWQYHRNGDRQGYQWGVFPSSYLKDFNANPDFPWESTLGLNISHKEGSKLYGAINFISLPKTPSGQRIPILVMRDIPVRWIFPPGTTVGEIIYVDWKGQRYIQEIRTRTKDNRSEFWNPGLFRPIVTRAEFQRITGLRYTPAHKFYQLRNPEEDEVMKLEGLVERVPNVPENIIKFMLSLPFKSALNEDEVWSPASDQDFHILPKNYTLGLLKSLDTETCAQCHRQTKTSVNNLIPNEPAIKRNQNFVGNIRGDDAVFTWHPFTDVGPNPNRYRATLREYDLATGVVRLHNKGQSYPEGLYKLTAFVQKSLSKDELPSSQFLHAGIKNGPAPTKQVKP